MADEIEVTNLVTKLSVDDSGVEQSMAQLARQMKVVQSEFQAASTKLGDHSSSQDVLKTKTDGLNKQMDIQAKLILNLKKQHEEAATAKGKDARETQNLETKLNKAVTQYNKMDSELKKTNTELSKMENELKSTTVEVEKQATAWQKASTVLDEASKKMESAGKTMTTAGQNLSLMVTVPLVAAAGASTKASIDFETSMASVRKTIDATEKEFQQIETSIRDMAKEMPASATAIAEVAAAAGQLGIKNESIMSFTRTMSDLGVATNMSAEQAATSLARLANITQMPQENFDKLGSTIVALGNNLATTEAEITEMALRLAGSGKQIGMTEAQILSFAGALSSVGIEAEMGGSAFSRVMIDMAQAAATGGKNLNNFAAVSGMTSAQFKESFQKDAAGALTSFIEGLGKMSKAGENTFGVLDTLGLSEIRVRDALLRASGAGDLFRTSLELGTKAWEDNTALTDEASKRYETTASQLKILGNRIVDTAITLGDTLVPALMSALDSMEPLFKSIEEGAEWFASLDPEMQQTVITMLALVAAAGPLLIFTGKLVTSIGALIPVVKGLGTALMFLTTNPIGLVITALGLAAGAFFAIQNSMENAKQAAEDLAQAQLDLQAVQENGITRAEVDSAQEEIDKLNELTETYQKLIDVASASGAAQMGNNMTALYGAADELGIKLEDLEKAANGVGVTLEFIDDTGKLTAKSMEKLKDATAIYTKAIKDANKETTSELNDKAKTIAVRNNEINGINNLIATYGSAKKGSNEWTAAQKELLNQFPQFDTATGINTEAVKGLVLIKEKELAVEWASIQAKATAAVEENKTSIVKQEAAIKIAIAIATITGAGGLAETAVRRMNDELARLRLEAASLQALAGAKPGGFIGPVLPVGPIVLDTSKKEPKAKAAKASKSYENKALDEAYQQMEHKKNMDQLTLESELKTLQTIQAKYVKTADEKMAIEEKIYSVKKELGDASLANSLDNYERAKDLGKLNENDEIVLLQRIKKLYANSADERKDMDDKIYEATKRKVEAEKQLRIDVVQYTSQQLQAAYEDRVVREKLTDEEAFKLKDKLYNEQIYLNKNYLQKVLADNRYSAAEKKVIERETTEEIRQQTNERLQLQKEYEEEVRKSQVDSINNISKGIQDALKAKYQEEKTAAEVRIKEEQAANELWKTNNLNSIKAVYEARVKAELATQTVTEDSRKSQLADIKAVYKARVEAATATAEAEIEQINSVYNAQIEAIQKQLDALNEAEKQKSRAEMDADDQKKIGQLTSKIDFEHDDFNKAQLQKEMNKVIADMNERHRQEELSDTKDALKSEQQELKDKLSSETQALKDQLSEKKEIMANENQALLDKLTEETQMIKDQFTTKKEILADEYEAQQANINAVYAARKTSNDQQLASTQAHYASLLESRALQAEAEKMIIGNQQEEILKLLNKFGDGYQVAGQTLGEKMLAGFKPQVDQISSMIANVIAQIDTARSATIETMALAASTAPAKASGGSASTTSKVSVVNNFNGPVTSPSSVSAATTKSAQQLALKI